MPLGHPFAAAWEGPYLATTLAASYQVVASSVAACLADPSSTAVASSVATASFIAATSTCLGPFVAYLAATSLAAYLVATFAFTYSGLDTFPAACLVIAWVITFIF